MIKRFLKNLAAWAERHWVEFFSAGALLLLMLFVLWPLIVYTVPSGHVGVMWYRFFGGTVTTPGKQLREGIHFILPWDKIYMYDARLRRIEQTVTGLSVDGLRLSIDLSSRFVINSDYVGFLHKGIGPEYQDTLMQPQLRTLLLTYLSEHESSDLYSTRRDTVQSIVEARFQAELSNISSNVPFDETFILLEDVLIEQIHLPQFVQDAIEQKERVRHMSEAYVFRLEMERQERDRKKIEADGIRNFQEIVAPGITDSYLRWLGIEATLKLSESNNAKIVVIGGDDGLPLILNTETGIETQQGPPLSVTEDRTNSSSAHTIGGDQNGADSSSTNASPAEQPASSGLGDSAIEFIRNPALPDFLSSPSSEASAQDSSR